MIDDCHVLSLVYEDRPPGIRATLHCIQVSYHYVETLVYFSWQTTVRIGSFAMERVESLMCNLRCVCVCFFFFVFDFFSPPPASLANQHYSVVVA